LLAADQFKRVFANPIRSADQYFTVLARVNDREYPRLGLAISRKAAASAVQRNRIKRVIRESFRHKPDKLPPVDVVVMARPLAATANNAELGLSLSRHWSRVRRKCDAC
jgi:ribonuclease P protein component